MTEAVSPVVAFDNTGTLSEVVTSVGRLSESSIFDAPVPEIPSAHPVALVGLAVRDHSCFETEETLAAVVEAAEIDVHLALANVEVDDTAVRSALLADTEAPARAVSREVNALHSQLETAQSARPEVPLGVQLVVGLAPPRIHRIIAYTTVPRPGARRVLGRMGAAGWAVHLVSGDRAPILAAVAEHLGIPPAHVHPDQSAADKAATIRALRRRAPCVAMVGDYVNDRAAFEAADSAVLIAGDGDEPPPDALVSIADVVVESLDAIPDVLLGPSPAPC
ncbi:MAG: HAD family hydrolase [Halobacteriaceae archaeon]